LIKRDLNGGTADDYHCSARWLEVSCTTDELREVWDGKDGLVEVLKLEERYVYVLE